MLAHTRKHHTEKAGIFFVSEEGNVVSLPKSMANSMLKHEVRDTNLTRSHGSCEATRGRARGSREAA